MASQRHRRHHDGSARRPEEEAEANSDHAAAAGGGLRRLLVPAKLLRGAAVQPRHRLLQRALLLFPLAGHELHLLQPLHLLLPEPHLPAGAEAPPERVQEEEERCGRSGAGAPPHVCSPSAPQGGLARPRPQPRAGERFLSLRQLVLTAESGFLQQASPPGRARALQSSAGPRGQTRPPRRRAHRCCKFTHLMGSEYLGFLVLTSRMSLAVLVLLLINVHVYTCLRMSGVGKGRLKRLCYKSAVFIVVVEL